MSSPERSAATRSRRRRIFAWARFVVGLGLAWLALDALAGHESELSGTSRYLSDIHWQWLALGAMAELASLAFFGLMQRALLRAADVDMSFGRATTITFAATAISNSMPAGPLVASLFAYRQYRQRGADEAVAGWMLVGVLVAASVSLAIVASIGVSVAGARGSGLDLMAVTVGVLVISLGVGTLFVQRRALTAVVRGVVGLSRRLVHWPRGELGDRVDQVVMHLTVVKLNVGQVIAVLLFGIVNWLLDAGCLALSFLAVGVGVPWKGLLLAYGAGQLAANLPITPGGLGVVEGSLTIALVAYGGSEVSTVAAVLLYRILSFWAELPLGWATWAAFAISARRWRSLRRNRSIKRGVAEVVA